MAGEDSPTRIPDTEGSPRQAGDLIRHPDTKQFPIEPGGPSFSGALHWTIRREGPKSGARSNKVAVVVMMMRAT